MPITSRFPSLALFACLAAAGCGSSSGGGSSASSGGSAATSSAGGTAAGSSSTTSAGGLSSGGKASAGSAGGGGAGGSASSGGSSSSSKSGGTSGGAGGTSRSAGGGGTGPGGGIAGSTAGGSTTGGSGGQSSGTGTAARPVTDKPSTDTNWSRGLKTGANGPIPWIVVDQFGYRAGSPKIAVIRSPQTGYDSSASFTPGSQYSVVSKATGKSVKDGTLAPWNGGASDTSSGDKVWWFDFSDVTAPGTYTVVDNEKNVRSVEFEIDDDVYRSVLRHAVRMFYYQRAGFEKTAEYAGADWTDKAALVGKGQDGEAHAWLAKTDESKVRDLHGGWFDAGDLNRYTAWASGVVITLLHAFEENPSAFGDDNNIPESGNGIPDLLDEVKHGIEWVVRMQNSDGSLLCVLGVDAASPPSAATKPSYYGPATTNASLAAAAMFAYAGKVYGARSESALKSLAADLKARAVKAWTWADANPSVTYHNNDDSKQSGSSGLAAGDQETDDAGRLQSKFQAAVHLYEITGEASYKSFAEANWSKVLGSAGPTEWDMEKADMAVYFSQLDGVTASVSSAIINQVVTNVESQLSNVTSAKDPYRAYMKDYTWGSNQIKMAQARLFQHLAKRGSGENASKAAGAAEDYVHYLHGVNPLGMVYLTNMQRAGAEHFCLPPPTRAPRSRL